MKNFILLLIGLTFSIDLIAQIQASAYLDVGESNYSNEAIVRAAALGSYQYFNTTLEVGGQFDISSPASNAFSGIALDGAQQFSIKKFPLKIHGIFRYNFSSDIIHETNWGFLLSMERKHLICKLGTSFRTFHITNEAIQNYEIDANEKLHENWNTVYLLEYNLKPIDNNWNVAVAVTNMDYFVINQETNPMVFLRGKYDFSPPWTIFLETWYKSAGSLNISANYLGFFIRTGVIWTVDLKK